jgi:galactokinase
VVTEDARVLTTVAALHAGRIADIGPLLSASHASMRDDFEITVPRVDLIATAAEAAGALGARMTGGGFGGCVLALVPADRVDAVRAAITDAYDRAGFGEPGFFPAVPSPGARRIG